MTDLPLSPSTGVRMAELLAVLSLGADLGMGQPMEHAMRQCLIALRLGERLGLERQERASLYYVSLIAWVGCHIDAYEQAVDRAALSFEHRSCSDDGNPTYALWSWQVSPSENGSTLTVTWAVYPRSFWRKLLIARARRPALADEVRASLAGMDRYLRTANLDRHRQAS